MGGGMRIFVCLVLAADTMLVFLLENMGLLCSRNRRYNDADAEENAQTAEIERRIELETKAEKHIQKLLLLGAGESGKSTIFKQVRKSIVVLVLAMYNLIVDIYLFVRNVQIKLLFQTGFDEAELKSYLPVIHANVYQTIKLLNDGSKEFAQNDADFSKYVISDENKEIGEKLSEIGGRLDYPDLTKELAQEIENLWKDPAIQETYARGSELQIPECTDYFMENLQRLSDANYVPTKEDVLYARVRTTGVVEIQFREESHLDILEERIAQHIKPFLDSCPIDIESSYEVGQLEKEVLHDFPNFFAMNPLSHPVGENKKSGEVYRLFDVGGQRNERRKWIHLFEGVSAVIFCAAISEYDQTLFEDENRNRMMETKELFEWVLKQPCFEFDIFEKKILKVPLNVCEWFKDYQPVSTGKQEIEHAYEFVKKKFEESYFQSTAPDRVDRVFKIYRTTALDQKVVKKTFKLVDETLRRRHLFEAGLKDSKGHKRHPVFFKVILGRKRWAMETSQPSNAQKVLQQFPPFPLIPSKDRFSVESSLTSPLSLSKAYSRSLV
ncbi:unnamed protein product [Sphenostylis stenocarpa]|uniref:Uncharacterized protein n=1 Tax=Sphenostylis stenocarpa TaxID=92480 RepID=A0AA86SUB0_9FABA|nr:unnamed protein product [Sphenostylis stenocarpa]